MNKNLITLKKSNSGTQLVCFPFVGGNAYAFNNLARGLNMDLEVLAINPPGHGPDTDKPLESLDEMASLYSETLEGQLKERVVFLGYSLGATVVYKTLQYLKKKPDLLILAASKPPHLCRTDEKNYELDEKKFFEFLDVYEGMSPELINDKAFKAFIEPVLRADIKSLECNTVEKMAVDIPCHLIGGSDDKSVKKKHLGLWREYFSNSVKIKVISGGHMFYQTNQKEFIDFLEAILCIELL